MLAAHYIIARFTSPSHHLQAERILAKSADSWCFDAFELSEATSGRPLSTMAFYLLHTNGLLKHCRIDGRKLARWAHEGKLQVDSGRCNQQTCNCKALACLAESGSAQIELAPAVSLTSRFLCFIEDGYVDTNPYHNKCHACSVLQVRATRCVHAACTLMQAGQTGL